MRSRLLDLKSFGEEIVFQKGSRWQAVMHGDEILLAGFACGTPDGLELPRMRHSAHVIAAVVLSNV